jgi:hypothetical protein
LYGLDGPRRRPSRVTVEVTAVPAVTDRVIVPAAPVAPVHAEDVEPPTAHPSVPDLWRGESDERAQAQRSADAIADLEGRFDTLRIELEDALDRRIRVAVDRMQTTFGDEVEALRTLNREEAKRIRSANDEAFVRVRVANTTELERIRAAIDEGVARLCSVVEGQLDRIWAANDVELERIRSNGADRLAEVHDLLTHQLDRLREQGMQDAPTPEPPMLSTHTDAGEHATTARHWLRRRRTPAAH